MVIACIISDDIDVFSLGVGLVKSDGGIGIDAQTFMSNDIRHIMCIKYLLMLTRSLPLTVGLLQTFALPHPSIGRACVMSRMSTVSVMMVDITLFHAVEAFLYHLDEGFLLICIFLTRGLCSSLIKSLYGFKRSTISAGVYAIPKASFIHSDTSYKYVAPTLYKAGDLPTIKTTPISPIAILEGRPYLRVVCTSADVTLKSTQFLYFLFR